MAQSTARASVGTQEMEREFVISRVFDAPRELVVEACTEAKQMARWWGPRSMTNPVCEMDVRPGSAYRIVMRNPAPESVDCQMKGVFREVVPPERLVNEGWSQSFDRLGEVLAEN